MPLFPFFPSPPFLNNTHGAAVIAWGRRVEGRGEGRKEGRRHRSCVKGEEEKEMAREEERAGREGERVEGRGEVVRPAMVTEGFVTMATTGKQF